MEYNAEQRRAEILELLNENGEVKVSRLSELFGTSEVTIRFDLEDLAAKGLLSRTHGGAVSSNKLYNDMDFRERMSANKDEKRAIAEYVAGMINDNDSIMMNQGTTLTYILRAIKGRRNITLVTNSITTATEASAYNGFNVILLGGLVNEKYRFTYGDDTQRQLGQYHADKLLLSVDGINLESGYSLFYSSETEVSRCMIRQASSVIVAADYSKIGRVAFADIAPIEAANHIVTNKRSPEDYLAKIRKKGIKVATV